jgi:putative DNA primase/helicase
VTEFTEIPVDDPLKAVWLDTSDFGNAKRVVIVAGGKLLWIDDLERWAWYDGMRYSIERGAIEAQRVAHSVIDHIDREALALAELLKGSDAQQDKAVRAVWDWCDVEKAAERVKVLRGHSVKSGSAGMTAGMLKQARSLLAARLEDFDTDPLAYNCLNGTLRFGQGKDGAWRVRFTEHDPGDRFMQVANVIYDPDAVAPFWEERLALLTPDRQQLAAFRPLYGYTLTGLTSDQAFYVHQGKGGDGKSATHMALADLHGDYYRHSQIETWLQGRGRGGAEHRSDLVRLRGDIRFVTSDEPPRAAVFDGAVMKQWTGSLVTARGANATTEITFRPHGKLHVECNVIPRAPSDDKGFRRRFKLYQHTQSLSDLPGGEMPIDIVLAQLKAESSGILNWLIDGAIEWLTTRKIPQPDAMAEVLAEFWASSSPLLEWMAEWCDTSDPAVLTPFDELYRHYGEWLERNGIELPTKLNKTNFGRDLTNKQHKGTKDGRGNRLRLGIKLRAEGLFSATAPPAGSGFSDGGAAILPPVGTQGGNMPSVDWEDDDDDTPGFR